jgi:hypothetical protein
LTIGVFQWAFCLQSWYPSSTSSWFRFMSHFLFIPISTFCGVIFGYASELGDKKLFEPATLDNESLAAKEAAGA